MDDTEYWMWKICTSKLRSMDWNYEIHFKNESSIKFCNIVKITNILLNNTRNR